MVLSELVLMNFKLLVSTWNLMVNVWEGKQMGQWSLLSFDSEKPPLLALILCPILGVIVCFWALGFCSVLRTCFLLETHAFCICRHPVSKWWRGTVCWASFCSERGATTHGRLLLKQCIVKTVFSTCLWNGKYFVLFKKQPKNPQTL